MRTGVSATKSTWLFLYERTGVLDASDLMLQVLSCFAIRLAVLLDGHSSSQTVHAFCLHPGAFTFARTLGYNNLLKQRSRSPSFERQDRATSYDKATRNFRVQLCIRATPFMIGMRSRPFRLTVFFSGSCRCVVQHTNPGMAPNGRPSVRPRFRHPKHRPQGPPAMGPRASNAQAHHHRPSR